MYNRIRVFGFNAVKDVAYTGIEPALLSLAKETETEHANYSATDAECRNSGECIDRQSKSFDTCHKITNGQ